MSRIKDLFQRKNGRVLNVYCTAGYPKIESTLVVIKALQENGADMVEVGMPYSDPLADGQVIQSSSAVALQNGMTIQLLFEQLQSFRDFINLPVILMGYMNPVLQYSFEKFCADAAAVGIDGLILPDLPEYEFESEYSSILKKNGLDFIFLITPETSEERVRRLDDLSSGFLYAVSSSSTTGASKNMTEVKTYLQRIKKYELKNPVLAGFGIKDKETFESACEYADGAIIGSAFIKALENTPDVRESSAKFIKSILF